jgi:hypothetical protein
VLHHLQTHQARALAYILENVPLLGDTRSHVMASVHEIRSWIRPRLARVLIIHDCGGRTYCQGRY